MNKKKDKVKTIPIKEEKEIVYGREDTKDVRLRQ